MKKYLAVASALVMGGSAVLATTITPNYDTFGSLPAATFGGTGIPNDAVAQTTISGLNQNQDNSITLALSATQRYSNPTVGNNGAGTFFATTGENNGLDGASPAHALGPTWNFDFYINIVDPTGAGYHLGLLYGNNTTGTSKILDFGSLTAGTYQDSWNLDMSFLSGIGFDPNANSVYGFELTLLNADGRPVGDDVAINVDVTGGAQTPDTASTAMLLGCGFIGLALVGRRQMRLATVAK